MVLIQCLTKGEGTITLILSLVTNNATRLLLIIGRLSIHSIFLADSNSDHQQAKQQIKSLRVLAYSGGCQRILQGEITAFGIFCYAYKIIFSLYTLQVRLWNCHFGEVELMYLHQLHLLYKHLYQLHHCKWPRLDNAKNNIFPASNLPF